MEQAMFHFPTPQPKTLADKAMLVRLKRSMFEPYVTDKVATAAVEAQNGVHRAGRYNKHLLKDSKVFAKVQAAYYAVYDYHMKHTLPWLDDGLRMLPSHLYFEYTQEMHKRTADAEQAVRQLQAAWSAEILTDKPRLGPMFDIGDYPADITARFSINLQFLPVPSVGDFRVDIDPDDRQSLERAFIDVENNISTHIAKTMLEPVKAMVEKLSVPIGEKGAIFRDSLIENVVETVERLERVNISADAELTASLEDIRRAIGKYKGNIDALREVDTVRTQAHQEFDAIMANLKGLFPTS